MSGDVALVTGGAKRIGRAIALRLSQAGYAVAIHCHRSRSDGEALAAEIHAAGGRAAVVTGDLGEADPSHILPDAAALLGPVTLLVNNASVFDQDHVGALEPAGIEQNMQVNMKAPVLLTQAFAAGLPEGCDGAVVNLIDQRVLRLRPDYFSYTIAKAALWTATQMLAQALAPRIRVNAVGPGPVLPNLHEGEAGFQEEVAQVPLKRPVDPADIAEAVLYLARARNVTGQMIAVDAGQHLP